MKIFDKNLFLELTQKKSEPFISIYVPTSRKSTNAYKDDQTRFKNQLSQVEKDLEKNWGMDEKSISKALRPAHQLLEDFNFWQHNSDLLAVFLAGGEMEYFQVPIPGVESMNFIGTKAFTMPLVPELNDDGHYYLLLLNLDRIRLYEATRDVIQEIILDEEEVAVSFTVEEEIAENQDHLQGQGGVGSAGAMYHGHDGGSDEEKKTTILNYFHRMTNMLEPLLNKNPLPLYLAGVDYLIPLFREASKYNHLQDGHVSGAFTEKDVMSLHQKSWQLASNYFSSERRKRMNDFEEKKSEGLSIQNDKTALIKAAHSGALDTLFVDEKHEHVWGTFDTQKHQVNYQESRDKHSHCLIDLTISQTIKNGGKVFLMNSDSLPGNDIMAGILRYPLS
ncbi:hypothetical protein SAMN04488519_11281 [Algoriphagus ornithinivorans]|uniref:Uncharacterized protein n=1 Tax=Algoriphagus ornithinivorans TaxID=226506 RepID=A0A1I5JGQ4_9BACT|nr:hypothetical protein [Algoriphagus ornithinivorans]SFO71733.1 hypothetical protein SAMN04488519_11281 [Algoriphagus ornithinivorans]